MTSQYKINVDIILENASNAIKKFERYENRTRVPTLEGWDDNHYTNRPCVGWCNCNDEVISDGDYITTETQRLLKRVITTAILIVGINQTSSDNVGTRVINSDMCCYGNNLMLTSYINVQLVYV